MRSWVSSLGSSLDYVGSWLQACYPGWDAALLQLNNYRARHAPSLSFHSHPPAPLASLALTD